MSESVTGLGPTFSADALAAESSLLGSLLPGSSGASSDPGAAGLDALAQEDAQETALLQSELGAQTGAYDSTGALPPAPTGGSPTAQLEQTLGGLLAHGTPPAATGDEALIDSALPAFAYTGGGTLLADSELFGSPTVDLFA